MESLNAVRTVPAVIRQRTGLDISICVCTFRRPEGLERCLASIAALTGLEGHRIEVVVVDNDATGSARDSFERCRQVMPWACRYVVEPRSGVGHARTRCLQESSGEWVAFLDDDEWAEPQWLKALLREAKRSSADGVFGPALASFGSGRPRWLLGSPYLERDRKPTGERLRWTDCASNNVLFKRHLFVVGGGFDPAFAASGAEDSDFFWRCLDRGAVFVWCDEAVVYEEIPVERMTRKYLRFRAFVGGQNYVRLHARRKGWVSYVRFAPAGFVGLVVFACAAVFARLFRMRSALRWDSMAAGALGKLFAAVAPPSTAYGEESRSQQRQRG